MTASAGRHLYDPDYASPPGDTLTEVLADRGMSQAELARRTGISTKHINQIVAGTAPLTSETALRLERVTGVAAQIWTNLEADYQVTRTRQEEVEKLQSQVGWLKTFPIADLVKRGFIRAKVPPVDQLKDLLSFFSVATPGAWENVWAQPTAYRKSQAFEVDYAALASWIRIGEKRAERRNLPPFDRGRFRTMLDRIKELTLVEDPGVWFPELERLCWESGVALVVEPEIVGARINGVTRWLPSERPLIQLSLRYRWADIFWFTFFHEVAHVLLHDRKRLTFIDTGKSTDNSMEAEADDFAGRTLLPKTFDENVRSTRTGAQILDLAEQAGVHPGIIVGRLQHDGVIPYSHHNKLRIKLPTALGIPWRNESTS